MEGIRQDARRIPRVGAKDEAGLQAWMVARLERYPSAHGKRLLGWDEILEGRIAAIGDGDVVARHRGRIDAARKATTW